MKFQIFHKYQDSGWIPTNLYSTDFDTIVRKAQECATNAIAYGMTQVCQTDTHQVLVEFPGGGGAPRYIADGYRALVTAALQHKVEVKKISPKKGCPDCKDGFYYPLIGPPEPCQTCQTVSPGPNCNEPPADIASYEEDSSKDISFDRQCKTAFNDIIFKDHPLILYSTDELLQRTIEFYSQHSRERRISILILRIQCLLNGEGAWMYNVNIMDTKFYELWDVDAIAWKTGVHLKIASVWRAE